ncbi:hypothetical protein BDZ90DRAFT_216463 [Jaminaea rosea]|uniref:Uncharacterized protein n=1 Tax=Jaminaea rosea TaxID=1569628 RepID=A0A316UX90_9BASI|nr:hypothetical protein BDZ90DRAFT_216463 [Jaminaea rosea]PWN29852.1 hypothetical protein BDZ90DRAFT_216463 [Jaminaea rosea]
MPAPSPTSPPLARSPDGPAPTAAPPVLPKDPTPNEIFSFYGPIKSGSERAGPPSNLIGGGYFDWYEPEKAVASPVRRDETPPVPLSQLPYPTFPAEYASCRKCEKRYPQISSCAQASSAFQNGTTIVSDPTKYYSIIKCACTDTFQSAYPQCLDCFQHTNQCWYLGTDPEGTQAPAILGNIRSLCALGSALLGGVASTNQHGRNGTYTPYDPGYYTDVGMTLGPGGYDESTGPLFSGAGGQVKMSMRAVWAAGLVALVAASLA